MGGKTGTADKVINGRYNHDHNFNAFLAAFPIYKPQYVVLTFIDDPRSETDRAVLAGNSAAPMVKEIISRSAAVLGVKPRFGENGSAMLVSY